MRRVDSLESLWMLMTGDTLAQHQVMLVLYLTENFAGCLFVDFVLDALALHGVAMLEFLVLVVTEAMCGSNVE
eukprot:11454118-Ditylum_brightwellii.AAC.1